METFTVQVPKVMHEVNSVITIADLIPEGRDNAISRPVLVAKCISHGLIDKSCKDKDRLMRNLLSIARLDWTILNNAETGGYYRPTFEDLQDLRRYIRQEEKRGAAIFKNIQMAKALYEDYKAGRKK